MLFLGDWSSVAVSSDGTKMIAAQHADAKGGYGQLYLSANYGWNWSPADTPPGEWSLVASFGDGTHLIAAHFRGIYPEPGRLFTSTDSGLTWAVCSIPTGSWSAVASSSEAGRSSNGGCQRKFWTDVHQCRPGDDVDSGKCPHWKLECSGVIG